MAGSASRELAINGGPKLRVKPWPLRGLFGEQEKQAAMALFDSSMERGEAFGYDGEEEQAYCREFAEFMGGGYADSVNSGTSALYVALRCLEVPPFTEVIAPPVTDPGGVMPIALVGCIPVPADTAPGSYNVGPEQIEERITEHTSAIVVTHLSGYPVDMGPIVELAKARGLRLIEDCAQSHGTVCDGRMAGTFGDVGAFSTMCGKHHATGGQGGVVFTRSEDVYWKSRRCSDRGKPFGLEGEDKNVVCSLNLNLNDLSAAIGRVQLRRLPEMVAVRRRAVLDLAERCGSLRAVRILGDPPWGESTFWRVFGTVDLERSAVSKDDFIRAVAAEGAPVSPGYRHVFTEDPWYENRAVFGDTGYPWTCPLYKGDPDKEYPLPNVRDTEQRVFRMFWHENICEQDIADLMAMFRKVEDAYCK